MEPTNTNPNVIKTENVCKHGHCCECQGCGPNCMHSGAPRYWRKHIIILILGVIAAFYVGMKLGELKGYMMREGRIPMHRMMQTAPETVLDQQ